MGAFCRWYEKDMENLSEHEQQQCEEKTKRRIERGNIFDNRNYYGKKVQMKAVTKERWKKKVIKNFCLERRTDGEINR